MIEVAAFYRFVELSPARAELLKENLEILGREQRLRGLVLFGSEGVNGTIAGSVEAIVSAKRWLLDQPELARLKFRDSRAGTQPFRRFKVELRPEIVTLDKPVSILPERGYLSPEQWHDWLVRGKECTLLDVRNSYEVRIGTFAGAADLGITEFNQFPGAVEKSDLPRDRAVLMYCTGGIRCEKASAELYAQGFRAVYQLQGGILDYLAAFPRGLFRGECFVFDRRVALDGDLAPTRRYRLCPLCGDAGDVAISCANCSGEAILCAGCAVMRCCSKNCRYHRRRGAARN